MTTKVIETITLSEDFTVEIIEFTPQQGMCLMFNRELKILRSSDKYIPIAVTMYELRNLLAGLKEFQGGILCR